MDLFFSLFALFFLSFSLFLYYFLIFKFLIIYFLFFILITLFYFISFFFLSFFLFFLHFLLGCGAGCQAGASEVGELSSGHWSRGLPAPCNIKWRKLSQRSPSQREDLARLNDQQATVVDNLCQTTSKTGKQPDSLAESQPKIIISSQTPQNTPPDAVLPTRKTRSSLMHQNKGTSPLHQEAYTTHWTNFSHWEQTRKTKGTMNLQPAKRRP